MSRMIRDVTSTSSLVPVATLHLDDGTSIEVGRHDIARILEETDLPCPHCGECAVSNEDVDPIDWPEEEDW